MFLKYNYGGRPMSVAPFSINGGTADEGGEASTFADVCSSASADDDDEIKAALASVGATIMPTPASALLAAGDPFTMLAETGTGAMPPPRFTPTASPSASSSSSSVSPSPVGAAAGAVPSITTIATGQSVATSGRRRGRDHDGQLPAVADPFMLMMMQMMKSQQEQAAQAAKRQDDMMMLFFKTLDDK
mgnify:CR=1 FL=1